MNATAIAGALRDVSAWAIAPPLERLGVAVSGGGDSMALLDLMHWHAAQHGTRIAAVTLDHGLRAAAKDEAAHVAAFCAARGVPHDVLAWDWDGQGNLQAAARAARYRLIAEWARARSISTIALGHTRDDVAETFLMRLARGSGLEGLAAMEPDIMREGVAWVRPLLSAGREALRAYLIEQGIPWIEDPSNEDDRFQRARARKALAALAPLGIDADRLATTAHRLWKARKTIDDYAAMEARAHVVVDRGDVILPPEMSSQDHMIPGDAMLRLRRSALRFVSGARYAPRRDAMTELEVALDLGRVHTLCGCRVSAVPGYAPEVAPWRVAREYNAVKEVACSTDALWDGRWCLSGPEAENAEIRALGDAVSQCPDWRATGLPRESLRASPSVWRGKTLVSAPLAGLAEGWTAKLSPNRAEFTAFLIQR